MLLKIQLDGPTAFKLVSITISISTFILFFLIIHRWISFRIATLTTFLFASSTLALAATRSSSYENLFLFAPIVLLLTGSVIKNSPRSLWVLPMLLLVTLTIYIPGFIWVILLCLILFIKPLSRFFIIQSTKSRIAGVLTILLVLLPFIVSMIKNTKSFLNIAGIPENYVFNVNDMLKRLYELPLELLASGPDNPAFWLSGTPILDAATATFVATGIYYLFKNKTHPIRRRVLILLSALICLLCVLLSSVFVFMLMPLIYIFAALGLTFLLEQWFHIFPRNPFAKSVGYGLMCILIITIASYHVSRYFIAWPRNETTQQIFREMPSDTIEKDVSAIFKETQ